MSLRAASHAALIVAAFALGGCDLFDRYFGAPPKKPLPGERVAVLRNETKIAPDQRIADLAVVLPDAVPNAAWPQPGGTPAHSMQHLQVAGIGVAWRVGIRSGTSRAGRLTSGPILADGRVYTLDAGTSLRALDAARGSTVWRVDVEAPGSRSSAGGGGMATAGGILYVATGQAQVLALDAATGKEAWRTTLTAPLRSGPTVAGNRLFVISVDNQVHALDVQTGRKLWSHSGITENAGLFGASSPAVEGNAVVASFSSGEIFALRAESGRVSWGDSLSGALRPDSLSALSDVRGLPVIERGTVFAVSHSGLMAAIDLRSGARIWEQGVGSFETPWLAGDFLFATTPDAEVVAVHRRDGRVRWVSALEQFVEPQKRRGRIVWTGPVVVGSRVLVFSSAGQAVTLSPETGAVMERLRMPGGVTLAPAVAGGTIYVVTDDAALVALR
ncbi:MAG: PQQ-binding-like beta-propeller repeat protein [Alphaproteobacteria bacterium]